MLRVSLLNLAFAVTIALLNAKLQQLSLHKLLVVSKLRCQLLSRSCVAGRVIASATSRMAFCMLASRLCFGAGFRCSLIGGP